MNSFPTFPVKEPTTTKTMDHNPPPATPPSRPFNSNFNNGRLAGRVLCEGQLTTQTILRVYDVIDPGVICGYYFSRHQIL